MCIIRAFNYIITIFHVEKYKLPQKEQVYLGNELTHAQIFNERDMWRQKCIEQSINYNNEIKRLHAKLKKYQVVNLS